MKFTDILTWIVLFIFVYLIYVWFFGSSATSTLSRLHDATQELDIDPKLLPTTTTANFSLSICFYVDDWNYRFGQSKTIFTRTTSSNLESPQVSFDPTENNINISLATYSLTANNPTAAPVETMTIENVPLQKWTSFILTLNGRALDIYLDGKLVNTKILQNVPKMSDTTGLKLTPGGGFSGSTANFVYYAKSLNPRDAYNIYKEGCGSSNWLGDLFNRYRIKLAFVKDNKEINSFQI